MTNRDIVLDALPVEYRDAFQQFAEVLLELASEELIGLSAFGGWLVDDPFFQGTPARSVVVLRDIELKMLDRLASSGAHFGRKNLSAPLMMTPEYVKASCDVFPLELLEIQQLHGLIFGADHFADLVFERRDVRLQCEREFKSELIQLRQGLLAAAGKHRLLGDLCRGCATRTVRLLRGVLYVGGVNPAPKLTREVVEEATDVTNHKLEALGRIVSGLQDVDFNDFERFYREVDTLTSYVDGLPND